MAQVSGTVYRYKSQERIPYASVKAWKKGDDTIHVLTDDDGDFIFVDLEPGKWTFGTLHKGSLPGSRVARAIAEAFSKIKMESGIPNQLRWVEVQI